MRSRSPFGFSSIDPAGPLRIPRPALVVLVGAAGSGKSTFAARHFPTEDILSSDGVRAMLTGDEADQRRNRAVFPVLHREVARRLAAGRLVVVDATNVERHARLALLALARSAGVHAIGIVLAFPPDVVHERNAARLGRIVDAAVVDRHLDRLAAALGNGRIDAEGFDHLYVLRSASEADAVTVERGRADA